MFDLFEEHLDLPATAVEVGHGAWRPVEVVGDELHLALLAIDLHQGDDAAQALVPVGLAAALHLQGDLVVAQDLALGLADAALDHMVAHVVLGSGDPADAPLVKVAEVLEVHISFVKEHHFALLDARADFAGALVVVVLGRVDDREARQKALEVEPQMALRGGLAPAMLRPVHARGHQLDGRGVHHMDGALEA